ncbi:hypothetical protein [Shewanella polaris]|uniref:Uncharacterized protein n=1 Tax=Shewanella polaris TaxID=2588449 RepID=A0A4Y5YBI6_9GAMM|nr:hypothetical protein [Shewanella polaris]QDE30112.1 hypothetical protein FH971_03445 [Shewanella polaris]
MKFRVWIVLVVILFVALTGWFYFNQQLTDPIASSPSQPSKTLGNQIQNLPGPSLETDVKVIPTNNYAVCKTLLQNNDKQSGDWASDNYLGWDKYLNEYSLDEVTLVVEKLSSEYAAVNFKVTQLRKNSELVQFNQKYTQLLHQDLVNQGVDLNDEFFREATVTRKVPLPEFENISNLSLEQQKALFDNVTPTIDDAAALMLDKHVSDQMMIIILDHINGLNAIVGFEELDTVSILDYAIYGSRIDVVKYLLESGVEPTQDSYLASSMEWALSGLTYKPNHQTAAIEMIKMLQARQVNARFNQQDRTLVEGFFPKNYYQFEAEKIESLLQLYGLDLLSIEGKTLPRIAEDHPLLQALQAQQLAFSEQELNVTDLGNVLSQCRTTVNHINQQWQPKSSASLLDQAEKDYLLDPQQTINQLAKIDPSLVDCLITRVTPYQRPQRYIPNLNQQFRLLDDGNINGFIDAVLTLPLTDANKNLLFTQALEFDSYFYDELLNSELYVDPIQYYDFNSHMFSPKFLSGLDDSGYDLYEQDNRGKTLLYYAVINGNLINITYIVDQKLPFKGRSTEPLLSKGLDPLHVALSIEPWQFKPEDAVEKVDLLMRYQPKIDEFHLRRMGLIKLKYPDVYQQIISAYSQLKVIDDNALPLSICGI